MNTDVMVRPDQEVDLPRTASEIRIQVNRIQEVMKEVMQNGVHYGVIPGCGDKPALLKPGAEKLMMTFRMAVDPDIKDLSTPTVCRYRVLARVTSITSGAFLGLGIGECSSEEEKYAWKRASVEQEWMEADPANRREKWMRGKQNTAYKIKQVRTNPADVSNTVLKMAKKRALIDAVLTVTAASDIFSQDIEEVEEQQPPATASEGQTLKDKLKDQAKREGAASAGPDVSVSAENTEPTSNGSAGTYVMKIGRQKGQPVSEGTDENLAWAKNYYLDKIRDTPGSRYMAEWEEAVMAIEAEQAERGQ